jgi:phosphonate transport system substrate-binding protein
MTRRAFLTNLAFALTACGTTNTAPAEPATIVLGVQATKPEETRAAWAPLVDDLGRQLGRPMALLVASQAEVVQALAQRRVHVAWLSSSAAIDAVTDADARAIALYTNVNGTQGYKAVLLTRKDSGIGTLEEALSPGKYRYAGGAKTSTSGHVLPQHFLFGPRGTSAEERFKSVVQGGHFPNLDALWAGQVDLAINNSTDLATFQARTPGAREGLLTLWESPLVPNDLLMVRADMAPALRQRLAALFIGYGGTPQEKELFRRASGISHFVAADNRLLEPVSGFKFATERAQLEQDKTLNAEERAQKLRALEQRQQKFRQSLAG